jgi:CheY-like chemotaxis protein
LAAKPFDLVVMDWRLPGIEGVENSRRLKDHLTHARVPAILMISSSEDEEVMGGLADPAMDAFLMKPVEERRLLDAIATIFGVKPSGLISELRDIPLEPPAGLIGKRVLIIEDNEFNRDLAVELLQDLGIEVSTAVNGREGVECIQAGTFDLVLMDIQMPEMDGLTATRLIRADRRFRDLPIVAMTAHAMNSDHDRSISAGMNDHLTKPISPNKLKETLIRWMCEPRETTDHTGPIAISSMTDEFQPREPLLSPFDLKAALAYANGKPSLLLKLLTNFRDNYANAATTLRNFVAEGKAKEAEMLAHSLRGVAKTLVASDLAKAASAVEHAMREGRTIDLASLIEVLENELRPAIAAVAFVDRQDPLFHL